eukprot:1189378-Rhodomonas_salina.3
MAIGAGLPLSSSQRGELFTVSEPSSLATRRAPLLRAVGAVCGVLLVVGVVLIASDESAQRTSELVSGRVCGSQTTRQTTTRTSTSLRTGTRCWVPTGGRTKRGRQRWCENGCAGLISLRSR